MLFTSLRILLVTLLFSSSVQALSISPVLVDLSPTERIVSVRVTNQSDQPIRFQTETLLWKQVNGQDFYEETQDLIISPPIADIAAQATQIFRVTLRRPPLGATEQAYRLILEDVSEVLFPEVGVIAIHFNHNLPVFFMPAGKTLTALRWNHCPADLGKGCLQLSNDGNRRIRLSELTIAGSDWQQALQVGTVLAGAWKQWIFDMPPSRSKATRIIAKSQQGTDLSSNISEILHK